MPACSLPALCFPISEPFLPGSTKSLHLFEARTLGALEESYGKCGGLIAHVCVAQQIDDGPGSAMIIPMASLARVTRLERLEVGVEVDILCEGRVFVTDVTPERDGGFLTVKVVDVPPPDVDDVSADVLEDAERLRVTLEDIITLAERLQSSPGSASEDGDDLEDDDMMWGHRETSSLRAAMEWADNVTRVRVTDLLEERAKTGDDNVASEAAPWVVSPSPMDRGEGQLLRAERLTFAAVQSAPSSSFEDDVELVSCRINAISLIEGEDRGLSARMKVVTDFAEEQRKLLRAKVALRGVDSTAS